MKKQLILLITLLMASTSAPVNALVRDILDVPGDVLYGPGYDYGYRGYGYRDGYRGYRGDGWGSRSYGYRR